MQQKVKSLKKKLEDVYRGNPWYGSSIKNILQKVDPKIVFTRPGSDVHTISELVAHMIAWREIVLKRLTAKKEFKISQKKTFMWERIDGNKKTAWKSLLNAFEKNQEKILEELDKLDDEYLKKKVIGKRYNMEFLLEGKIQHDLYHLGQISLLEKLIQS